MYIHICTVWILQIETMFYLVEFIIQVLQHAFYLQLSLFFSLEIIPKSENIVSKVKAIFKVLERVLPDFSYFLLKYYISETLLKNSKQKLSESHLEIKLLFYLATSSLVPVHELTLLFIIPMKIMDRVLFPTFSFVVLSCIASIIFCLSSSLFPFFFCFAYTPSEKPVNTARCVLRISPWSHTIIYTIVQGNGSYLS